MIIFITFNNTLNTIFVIPLRKKGWSMENMNTEEQKLLFKNWLQTTKNLSSKTLKSYTEDIIPKLEEIISLSNNEKVKSLNPNIYSYQTKTEFDYFVNTLKSDPNFDIVNRTGEARGGWVSTPLNHYGRFLAQRTTKDIKNLRWWEIVAIAIYNNDKYAKYRPVETEKLPFVQEAKKIKNASSTSIATELRECSDDLSTKYNRKNKNYFKREGDYYYLSEEGIVYIENNLSEFINDKIENSAKTPTEFALNLILYGPPGTGKTYNTILKAMSIIDNTKYHDVTEDKYAELKARFDKLKQSGQIEFVTFHQSYSYEEFVEGIKPYIPEWGSTENNDIKYIGEDGIFKNICKRASKNLFKSVDNNKKYNISFLNVLNIFKEKYPEGSDFENLIKISYEKNCLIYHFGKQDQNRKIDLLKIEKIFNNNKQFRTSAEFNLEYEGNSALKGYCHTFYKELMKIKNEMEDENQIYVESNGEYAINQNAQKYILIIDEINRGDVSKIFGELITLIEEDKRVGNKYQMKTMLPYSKEYFGVPNNLYIIGTMNTADRSIALLDTALRRRFDFEEIMPKPELLYNKIIEGINLRTLLENINRKITEKYDQDHQIGHSYLMNINSIDDLERAYKNRILPLLNEYFYNDSKSVAEILNCSENDLRKENFITILNKAQNADKQ